MITYAFFFLSFLAVLSALMVIFSKNPVYSVLYLIVTFFCIAGHYLLLNAQFLAAVHVIVYAGAIMVLFLYVIMMLNLNINTEPNKSNALRFAAVFSGGLILMTLVGSIRGSEIAAATSQAQDIGLIKNLGKVLFRDFLMPFEAASILFLSAMVGAVMLGKKNAN
jgi:NADH-quinone oxidoreductase subunit J